MAHRHYVDNDPDVKPCIEVGPNVCLTPVSDGYFVHFDEPDAEIRGMGHVTVGPAGWTQTGSLEGGDLTLHPSIAVRKPIEGQEVEVLHGWVRGGKWVPA